MNEPRRILSETDDPLALGLLRSWQHVGPDPALRRRTAIALGVGATSFFGSTVAWGLSGLRQTVTLSRAVALKGFFAGALVGAGFGGAVQAVRSNRMATPPPPAPIIASVQPAAARGSSAPNPLGEPGLETAGASLPAVRVTEPARSQAEAPAATSASPLPESIAGEIAVLDRARNMLAGRDAPGALRLLESLEARGHSGTFDPELVLLRVEALDQSGQYPRAAELIHHYLSTHPNGPAAGRLRARLR